MRERLSCPPGFSGDTLYHDAAALGSSLAGGSVVCIGTFDGVHRGHQAILGRGEAIARKRGLPLLVVTFHPHPKSVVAPGSAPLLLSDPEEKYVLLRAYGAEAVLQLNFDKTLASTSADAFLEGILRKHLGVEALVFGYDFGFGRGRTGTPEFLRSWGEKAGCQIEVVDAVKDPDLNERISSSLIRNYMQHGEFDLAVRLLGHPYPVSGTVVPGAGRGRKIGYPTWNLEVPAPKLSPPVGVYAGWAGRSTPRPAMAYYGFGPTFTEGGLRLETHLLDTDDQAAPDTTETVWLSAFVRKEITFTGADALARQIAADERTVRDILSVQNHHTNAEEQ